jgi:hypothetical protein
MDTVHDSWLDWSFGGHRTGLVFINYIWLPQTMLNGIQENITFNFYILLEFKTSI